MATLEQLEKGLIAAHKAGDSGSARRLAAIVVKERQRMATAPASGAATPEQVESAFGPSEVEGTVIAPPEPTIGEQAMGVGEVALSMATGATGGTLGMIGGTLKGLAEQILSGQFGTSEAADKIEKSAMETAEKFTYAPRGEPGQEMLQTISDVTAPLAGIAPMVNQLQPVTMAARTAAPIARAQATLAVPAVTEKIKPVAQVIKDKFVPPPESPYGSTTGAQQVAQPVARQALAEELPVPIQLTEGQKTRSFEQQRFERETAKLPEEGAPIRERFSEQNLQLQQNMDAFIDQTGSKLGGGDVRGIGEIVDKALRERAAKDKTRIRTLYKEAEMAGEMEDPVDLSAVMKVLNESRSAESTAPVLVAARKEMIRLGMATEDENGNLVPRVDKKELPSKTEGDEPKVIVAPTTPEAAPVSPSNSLKNVEQLRKFVNKVTGADPTNVKFAIDIKKAIDTSTEGKGGDKYKIARKAREKYGKDYEDVSLVDHLLNTKRGTSDRAITIEDVLRKVALDPSTSLDQMRHVKRLLMTRTGGNKELGVQAWKEIQAGVLNHIKEQMTKGVSRDQAGNPIVSAAGLDRVITQLDKTKKLDFLFGKKGAEQLRTINEVAKDVLTAPPGAVNTSNTATVLAGLMDVAISGTAGIPAPIMSSFRILSKSIKDKKLKAKVQHTLGDKTNAS